MRKLKELKKSPVDAGTIGRACHRLENLMTNRIIPSTVQTDYKRPTRMQTIAGCAGFAALAFVPSIIDAALSLVHIPDAAVLALVALVPVALIVAAAKM